MGIVSDGCTLNRTCHNEYTYYYIIWICLDTYAATTGSSAWAPCTDNQVSAPGSSSCTYWGNSLLNTGEECDDGNMVSGDGWSKLWAKETGFTCTAPDTSNPSIWTTVCGDGIKVAGKEKCDDKNTAPDDGWSANWIIEYGMKWVGGDLTKPDVWSVFCGDGIVFKDEQWDDGNVADGDGWSSSWKKEDGFSCSRNSGDPSDFWTEIWGDG